MLSEPFSTALRSEIITLDNHASALLCEHLDENPSHDPRDVVSAAIDFLLGVEVGENYHSEGAIEEAEARRLSRGTAEIKAAQTCAKVAFDALTDPRLDRLLKRRADLLKTMMHPVPGTERPGALLKSQMTEFEEMIREIAEIKARRKAEPITPYTVTLDEHASRLVRSIVQDERGFTAEDVVNGAVYFNADDEHDGSPGCFKAARAARLRKEGR